VDAHIFSPRYAYDIAGACLFYGGMAKTKDTLNTIAMSFVAYSLASVIWVIYGYSLAFGPDVWGLIGSPSKIFLHGIIKGSVQGTIPEILFVMFQLTFCAISTAIISGSYIERMKFSAWIIFVILWTSLVYIPVAHWVWGGGFLQKLNALDFAGGTVVHINAGIAGLVGAILLGKRRNANLIPNNLPMVVLGTGLLWFGWFGFNGGSALASNALASYALLNTNTAAAAASLSWILVEWLHNKKPTLLGLASGAVAGLVAITPAAGYVDVLGAIMIGLLAGIIPYFMVTVAKKKLGYDDALDAFGIHGIAGILGALLTGIFADPSVNETAKGLLYGNPKQLWAQFVSVVVTIIYSALITLFILVALKFSIGLRVKEEEEIEGLDSSQHGEKAYNLT